MCVYIYMCVCSKRERERNFVCCWKAEIGKKEDSEESLSIIHKFFYLQISTLVIRPLREKKFTRQKFASKLLTRVWTAVTVLVDKVNLIYLVWQDGYIEKTDNIFLCWGGVFIFVCSVCTSVREPKICTLHDNKKKRYKI